MNAGYARRMRLPIETDRLLLREVVPSDAPLIAARRSDPEVARYAAWDPPYPLDAAVRLVDDVIAMGGPIDDGWWMLTVERKSDGVVVGGMAVHPTFNLRTIEIGYDLADGHRGRGYAAEAVAGLVPWLFDTFQATRITGMLHPDNMASARVLERNGFLYEGHTRNSYWLGDENVDDLIYGLTPDDWRAWVGRTRRPPDEVRLEPVDQANESAVFRLKTHWSQRRFVAPMEWSYADALFPEVVNGAPLDPWLRAVHADDELVAFVMLALPTDAHPEPYLWRLLVDRLHQRRGIGRRTLDLVVEECRRRQASSLVTSWVPGRGSPEPFYLGYGFEPTGEIVDDEIEARLAW